MDLIDWLKWKALGFRALRELQDRGSTEERVGAGTGTSVVTQSMRGAELNVLGAFQ